MSCGVPWRRVRPELVGTRAQDALRKTLYILRQNGPTGFLLQEEGRERKYKVLLGSIHQCTCSVFQREAELCVHILWVLLKKFRVPQENPISYQLGLAERDINFLLGGYFIQQPKKTGNNGNGENESSSAVAQREICDGDVCPICQEEFIVHRELVTYCRFGCGQSVHVKCMRIWSQHRRKGEELQCPLCRVEFGAIKMTSNHSQSKQLYRQKPSPHLGVACTHCQVCPITGSCYHCQNCPESFLCHDCFSSNHNIHTSHPYEYRKNPTHPWRPVPRSSSSSLPTIPSFPSVLVTNLQNRSLTEQDYELLLNLDSISTGATPQESLYQQRISQRGQREGRGERERRRRKREEEGRRRRGVEDDRAGLSLSGQGIGNRSSIRGSPTDEVATVSHAVRQRKSHMIGIGHHVTGIRSHMTGSRSHVSRNNHSRHTPMLPSIGFPQLHATAAGTRTQGSHPHSGSHTHLRNVVVTHKTHIAMATKKPYGARQLNRSRNPTALQSSHLLPISHMSSLTISPLHTSTAFLPSPSSSRK